MIALLFIILGLGIILEAISLKRDPSKMEFDYVISTVCTEPGDTFSVHTIITNKSLVPVSYLAVREVYPMTARLNENMPVHEGFDGLHVMKVCRIKGRQRKKLILETSIKERGVHTFKGDSIEFGDFLGFREVSKAVSNRQELVVYPEKLNDKSFTDALGSFCGDLTAKRFLIRDPILTVGYREYTGRESMKEIHWLQSAHRGMLMVREFDYNRQLSASVILSVDGLSLLDTSGLDMCCFAARTACETLAEAGVPVSFFTNARLSRLEAKDVWRCEVSAGRTGALLEGLGRVTGYSCSPLDKLLDYAMRESDFNAAFIIILPAIDNAGAETVVRLRSTSGREILLVQQAEGAA